MLFGILLTAQVLICAVLGGLILIQRSEGGALGMGGGPSGFMSARGAGNLLTKLTWVFAAAFGINCLAMTVVGNLDARGTSVVDQVDMSKLAGGTPVAPTAATSSAAASTSSAPSLNDLPLASTPNAQTAPASSLSQLPLTSAAPSSSAAAPVVPVTKMPKPLAMPASHAATTPLPSALGNASVSLAPVGAKSSHSASAPSIFPSSSSSAASKPSAAPSSSASTTPSAAPASTPASSQ